MNKAKSKLFMTVVDIISIFRHWNQVIPRKGSNFSEDEITYNLTEMEWDSFWNTYIGNKTHNPLPVHIKNRLSTMNTGVQI